MVMGAGDVIQLNRANFAAEVLQADKPVLVEFWAGWCGPCKNMTPVIAEIADEYDGRARFGRLNIDDEEDLAREYGIRAVPTSLVFKNGQVVENIVGSRTKADLMANLDKHLFA